MVNDLILDLSKVKKDVNIPAFIRLLAYEAESGSGYIQTGSYIRNMSNFDFAVLSALADDTSEFISKSTKEQLLCMQSTKGIAKTVKYFSLFALLLANCEGIPGINNENLANFVPNLFILVLAEKISRISPELRKEIDISKYGITDDLTCLSEELRKRNDTI